VISKYQSDPYVKAFAGRCANGCRPQLSADCKKNKIPDCEPFSPSLCRCHKRPNGESTSPEELREALANLKRFDAIVTLEHFGDPLLAEWLCTLLFRGPPPPGALAAIDSPPIKGQISFVGSPVKDNGRQKRASSAPAALQAELEARNAHDHVLYDYAHRRVTLALDCFRNSPRSYGAARSCFDIGADPPAVP